MKATGFNAVRLCLFASGAFGDWTVGKPVNTTSGLIVGHAAPNASSVSEYLAIPFGQPPVGDLRFAVPQPYTGTKVVNSTTFPLNCPQPTNSIPGLTEDPSEQLTEYIKAIGVGPGGWTEDCLHLNVWTKPQTGDAKKAVMIWFHPGGFRSGGSNNPGISGQYYADKHDVIVVTFNYRVSALGFPGIPGGVQNLGFYDQRLAVEWVRDNIEAFGGDTDRIILFAESAGAAGVDYYNYVYTEDPIISGAIMESGSTTLGNAISNEAAESLWNKLTNATGCSTNSTSTDAEVACVRALNITSLVNSLQSVTGGGYLFNPSVDNVIVFDNYTTLQNEGHFIKKPILIGNNDYEAAWFKLTQGFTHPESYYEDINLNNFTCVSRNLADLRRNVDVPSWRYRFYPIFPDTAHPYNSSLAMHTSEVPLVWGTADDAIPSTPTTAEERALSNLIMGYWSTFAKDPVNGLTKAGWPLWNSDSESLALFGRNGSLAKAEFVGASLTDGACSAESLAFST